MCKNKELREYEENSVDSTETLDKMIPLHGMEECDDGSVNYYGNVASIVTEGMGDGLQDYTEVLNHAQ